MTDTTAVPAASRSEKDLLAACVHCGLCLEACPTFVETGREEESPRGRLYLMRALEEGTWGTDPEVLGPLAHCLGCRSCETACPSGVRYGAALERTRDEIPGAVTDSAFERFLVRRILWRAGLLETLARIYRALRVGSWLPAAASLTWLPERWRRLAALAPQPEPITRTPPRPDPPANAPTARVLRGCVARALFPESEAATVRLLAAAGYRVELEDDPPCCGALARHAGEVGLARRLGRDLLERDATDEAIWVPTAAGCGAHLKQLSDLYPAEPLRSRAASLAGRVRDLTEALLAGPGGLSLEPRDESVVYQDACHLRHGQGLVDPPRELLRRAGADPRPAAEADLCCGSAGTYNLFQGDMAARLGRRKREVLLATGARTLVTANPGCALQMEAHLRGSGVEVTTLARFLAGRLPRGG